MVVVCPGCSAKLGHRRSDGGSLWNGRDTDLYCSDDVPSRSLGLATCPECGATAGAQAFEKLDERPGFDERPQVRAATASEILDGIEDGSLLASDTAEEELVVRRLAFLRRNHPPNREAPPVDDPRWRANAEALIVVLEGYPEGSPARKLQRAAKKMEAKGLSGELFEEKADAQELLDAIEHDLLRAELLRHLERFSEAGSALDSAVETAGAAHALTEASPHTKSVATPGAGQAIAAVIATQRRLIAKRDTEVHRVRE